MANESQDLVFNLRANTGNAEQGLGKVARLSDDLKITTEKTSGALREFGNQLKNARDASDVAGMATKALSQVLGASLGGTAVLVAGKALFDAFNSVQIAVKDTQEKVATAFKDVEKAGLPKTFDESATQADKLATAADVVAKKIKEIESSPLQNFVAGITGAKDKMEELVVSTQKAAQERIALGTRTALADEEFQSGLNEKEKALNDLFKSYQAKADKIASAMLAAGANPADIKPIIEEIYNAHTKARDKMLADYALKEYAVEEENARKSSDLRRSLAMSEFDLEQKSKDRIRETERSRATEELEATRKRLEEEKKAIEDNAKKQEELQNRLMSLVEKRMGLEEKITQLKTQGETLQAQAAAQAAGMGGTSRGAGQKATSYEIGAQKAIDRAAQAARRQEAQQTKQNTQDTLLRGMGIDPSKLSKAEKNAIPGATPEAVQQEMTRQRAQSAADKVKKEGSEAQKENTRKTEEASKALDENTKSIDSTKEAMDKFKEATKDAREAQEKAEKQSKEQAVKGKNAPEASGKKQSDILTEIKKLLQDNFNELKSYAHAT